MLLVNFFNPFAGLILTKKNVAAKIWKMLWYLFSWNCSSLQIIQTFLLRKVRTFWEHTNFEKNLPHGFDKSADLLSKRQNHKEVFSNYVCFSKSLNFTKFVDFRFCRKSRNHNSNFGWRFLYTYQGSMHINFFTYLHNRATKTIRKWRNF